ncbi:MAG: LysR family transcriptional regulator [Proteobacteria bacterium]|nr:LysR family transcriptional regulator [Pseudomonadota bacterium]
MAEFRNLETFMWVVKLGSFHGAAAKLSATQPAISQRIAQLETEFGVQLLRRDSRPVVATKAGRDLLIHAERLLRMRTEMEKALAAPSAMHGVLRLGVSETIVHTWLSHFIDQVAEMYPSLALEIEVDISANLRERLVAQDIDLAFLLGPVSAASIHNRDLCRFPLAFIASPAIRLPPSPVPLAALAKHPLITFSRLTRPYMEISALFAQPDFPPIRLHATASLAPAVRMALDGRAIAIIPPAIVEKEIAEKKLRIIAAENALPDLSFTASWPNNPGDSVAEIVADIAIKCAKTELRTRRAKRA